MKKETRIKSNMSMFIGKKALPENCKGYLNIPEKVFRQGQWVNIQSHNDLLRKLKRMKKRKELKAA